MKTGLTLGKYAPKSLITKKLRIFSTSFFLDCLYMATPKGISSQHIKVLNGDAVHIYNDNDFIVLQLRSETPTVESRLR